MTRWIALALCLNGCAKRSAATSPEPFQQPDPIVTPPAVSLDTTGPDFGWDLDALEPLPGDAVTLRFGWSVGQEATVRHAVVALQYNGDVMSSRTSTDASWTDRFVGEGEGHRYLQEGGDGTTHIVPRPVAAEPVQAVMTALALASVEVLVDEHGTWVGVEGLDGLRSEIAGRLAPVMDGLPEPMRRALGATLEQGLAEDVVRADSQRRWNSLVGSWIGLELQVGVPVAVSDGTVELKGWVPCGPDATDATCVAIERNRPVSQAELAQARDSVQMAVVAAWPSGAPVPRLGESEMVSHELLVTHPDTLIPVAYARRKAATHAFHVDQRVVPWGRDLRTSTLWSWSQL